MLLKSAEELTYSAVINAYYAFPGVDREKAVWVIPAAWRDRVEGLTDGAGQPLLREAIDPLAPDRLIDRPIRWTDGSCAEFIVPSVPAKVPGYGEPWELAVNAGKTHLCDCHGGIFGQCAPRDARRIVACVNACAGLEDPVKLRRQRDRLRDLHKQVLSECAALAAGQLTSFKTLAVSIRAAIKEVEEA